MMKTSTPLFSNLDFQLIKHRPSFRKKYSNLIQLSTHLIKEHPIISQVEGNLNKHSLTIVTSITQ